MITKEFKHLLGELIITGADELEEEIMITDYQEAGILTHNEGLVLKLENGEKFQITIH